MIDRFAPSFVPFSNLCRLHGSEVADFAESRVENCAKRGFETGESRGRKLGKPYPAIRAQHLARGVLKRVRVLRSR